MDDASTQATKLLRSLANCNEAFIDLCQTLRSSPSVTNVLRGFDCRAYQTGLMIEAFADAELTSGKGICWWFELTWNDQHWLIHTCVLVNDDQGQRTFKEFEGKIPSTLDELVVQLKAAMSELVASATAIDLKDV